MNYHSFLSSANNDLAVTNPDFDSRSAFQNKSNSEESPEVMKYQSVWDKQSVLQNELKTVQNL
jgi:hypothetical protein